MMLGRLACQNVRRGRIWRNAVKIACQESLVTGATFADKVAKLADYGFEGVEVWGSTLRDRVDIVQKATAGRIPVSTICSGYRGCFMSPDKAERDLATSDMKDLLKMAGDLGAKGVIFVPLFGPPQLPDLTPLGDPISLEKDLLCKLLEDMAPVAEQAGVFLLLEPLNRYETHMINTLAQGTEILDRVGHPNVKMMADLFHMSVEERDIPGAIRAAGSRVQHVHLADSTREVPCTGHTDFRSAFAALREVGFDGYMAFECKVPGDPAEWLPKSVKYLREQMG
jgi:sugar phosphate isomerase/epimerase